MNEIMGAVAAGLGGVLVGTIFFGGLWWTVYRGLFYRRSATIFLCSALLRYGLGLLGFYFIFVSGSWMTRIVPGMLGFIISRSIIKSLTGNIAPEVLEGG